MGTMGTSHNVEVAGNQEGRPKGEIGSYEAITLNGGEAAVNANHEGGHLPASPFPANNSKEPQAVASVAVVFSSCGDGPTETEEKLLVADAPSADGGLDTSASFSKESGEAGREQSSSSKIGSSCNVSNSSGHERDKAILDEYQDDRSEPSIRVAAGTAGTTPHASKHIEEKAIPPPTSPPPTVSGHNSSSAEPAPPRVNNLAAPVIRIAAALTRSVSTRRDHHEHASPNRSPPPITSVDELISPPDATVKVFKMKDKSSTQESKTEDVGARDVASFSETERKSNEEEQTSVGSVVPFVAVPKAPPAESACIDEGATKATNASVGEENKRPSKDKDGAAGGFAYPEDAATLRPVFSDKFQSGGSSSHDRSSSTCDSVSTEGSETSHLQQDGELVEPTDNDILCGRGRGYFQHPGNRRMLEIVKANKGPYKAAPKMKKTEIVWGVTRKIELEGSRFLKYLQGKSTEKTGWVEASATEKHKKVCHCLREEKHNASASSASESTGNSGRLASPISKTTDAKKIPGLIGGGKPAKMPSSLSHFGQEAAPEDPSEKSHPSKQSSAKRRMHSDDDMDNDSSNSESEESARNSTARNDLDILGMAARTLPTSTTKNHFEGRHPSSMLGDLTGEGRSLSGSNPAASTHQQPPRIPENSHLAAESVSAFSQLTPFDSSIIEKYGIVVGEPAALDVLFGHDPSFYSHTGNINLRMMLQGCMVFPPLDFETKLLLARRIVAELNFRGARFLTRQRTSPPGIWYRVDDIETESLIFRLLDERESGLFSSLSQVHDPSGQASINAERYLLHETFAANSLRLYSDPVTNMSPEALSSSISARAQTALVPNGEHPTDRKVAARNLSSVAPSGSASRRKLAASSSADDMKTGSSSPSSSEDETSQNGVGTASNPNNRHPSSPGPHDVICGRGRGNFRHRGNRNMLRMFWEVKDRYNKGTKMHKTMIGREIIEDIRSKGGRFLKQSEDGWEEVDSKTVLRKVCHGIRDIPTDPEKRKRSIVADELDDPLHQSIASTTTTSPYSAPWLASQPSKRTKKAPISGRLKSDTNEEGGSGKNPIGRKIVLANNLMSELDKGGLAGVLTTLADLTVKNDAPVPINSSKNAMSAEPTTKPIVGIPVPAETLAEKEIAVGTRDKQLEAKEDAALVVQDASTADDTNIHNDIDGNAGDILPTNNDVLLGRGKGFFQHQGNRRMQQIIGECTTRYKGCSKLGKSRVVREVIAEIQSNGARFLKRTEENGGGWGVVDPGEALQKVSHGIRDYMASLKITPEERSRKRKLKSKLGNLSRSPSPQPSPAKKRSAKSDNGRMRTESSPTTSTVPPEHDDTTFLGISRTAAAPERGPPNNGRSNFDSFGLAGQGAFQGLIGQGRLAAGMMHHSGIPYHVLLAASQRGESEAAIAAATGIGPLHRLSHEEHLMLLQAGNHALTPAEQLILLRQRELQRRFM